MVAVGDHLAHQRRVVGGDVVADELGHVREAHHLVVERRPTRPCGRARRCRRRGRAPGRAASARPRACDTEVLAAPVAGQVRAVVAGPVDQRVQGLAVRGDGGDPDGAVLVGEVLAARRTTVAPAWTRLGDAPVDVGHLEGDVDDAVAVPAVVVGQRAVGVDRAVDHEPDRARAQHEGLVVAVAVLRAGVGLQLHPPGRLVVVRGLGRVADDEDDRVPAGDREDVLVLVVLDQADELLELVEGRGRRGSRRGSGRAHGHRMGGGDKVCNSCATQLDTLTTPEAPRGPDSTAR